MKKRKWMAIPAIALAAALLFGAAPAAEREMPPVYSSTQQDADFPVVLTPKVDPDSVFYLPAQYTPETLPEPSENAGYDPDLLLLKPLDTARLSAGLEVSLKPEADAGLSYHITLSKGGKILLDTDLQQGETFTVPQLVYNGVYDLTVTQESAFKVVKHIGSLWYGVDVDNTVFAEVDCQAVTLPGRVQSRNVTTTNETENNNTMATADSLTLGATMKGILNGATDTDYFVLTIPSKAAEFGGKLNITLAAPDITS